MNRPPDVPPENPEATGEEWSGTNWRLRCDRAEGFVRRLREEGVQVDAIVTDPPYGISLLGNQWDREVPQSDFWQETLAVLRPGGYLLVFGAPKRFFLTAHALYTAGARIEDTLFWFYSTGFTWGKSADYQIDELLGRAHEREPLAYLEPEQGERRWTENPLFEAEAGERRLLTAPASEEAKRFRGANPRLRSVYEPIILAQKPRDGTIAENLLKHGTGALNIEPCRVGDERVNHPLRPDAPTGLYPGNVILDESVRAELRLRSGDPLRCCYTPKATREEREAGLEDLPLRRKFTRPNQPSTWGTLREPDRLKVEARFITSPARNYHPTVKPLDLMRWLVRLVTWPNALILDPFAGTGSTACAALLEGRRAVCAEVSAGYCELAHRRIRHWAKISAQSTKASLFAEEE